MPGPEAPRGPAPDPAPAGRSLVLRALSWSAASALGAALLVVARTLLLPRLLSPEEFGLFGLAWFALSLVSVASDPALGRVALGLKFEGPVEERSFLDTLWTFGLARALALAAVVALAAWPYALLVHQPRLGPLLAVSGLGLLLGAWGSPGGVLLFRQYDQRTLALQRLATEGLTLACTAVAAFLWPTAWALVLGSLLGPLSGAAASYLGQPYRPRLAWDRAQLRRGLTQGRHLGLVSLLTFVTTQVDNLLVGRALGAAALGTYQFAYRMGALPLESLYQVVTAAALPAYARLREQGTAAVAARLRLTLSASTFLLCAAFLPALLLRRELVLLVGGARWEGAAPLLPPILLLCLLRSANQTLGTLLLALERSDLDARVKLVEAALFVPGCAMAVAWFGSAGAAWAGVASYALALVLRSQAALSLLPGEGSGVRLAWARPVLCALACAGAGLWLERAGVSSLLLGLSALLVFVAAALRLDPALWREMRSLRRADA